MATATKADYALLMKDRPVKFSGLEVDFHHKSKGKERCGNCFHFAVIVNQNRNTCEIMRLVPEESVPPFGV